MSKKYYISRIFYQYPIFRLSDELCTEQYSQENPFRGYAFARVFQYMDDGRISQIETYVGLSSLESFVAFVVLNGRDGLYGRSFCRPHNIKVKLRA